MAQSIVAAVEVIILITIMVIRDPKLFNVDFGSGLIRMVSVTGFTVLTAFIALTFYPLEVGDTGFVTLGTKLFFIAAITSAVYVSISGLFGLEEARPVFKWIKRIVTKPLRIQDWDSYK
jgi:hypothetical protein